jgi:hypothetical protein
MLAELELTNAARVNRRVSYSSSRALCMEVDGQAE